jgi:mannose-6-phosphate isomerase-like protein (cupin superfamily)
MAVFVTAERSVADMHIFLSWSGSCSRAVATALRDWLPYVIPEAEVWISDWDIKAGQRWSEELDKELEAANFGILCLVPTNLNAPWLLFEAGALSKRISGSRVVPYCAGLSFDEVGDPFSRFQGVGADEDGTRKLIQSINSTLEKPQGEDKLEKIFHTWWPKLQKKLKAIRREIENDERTREAELIKWPEPLDEPFYIRGGKPSSEETGYGYTVTVLYNNPGDRIVSYVSATQTPDQMSSWHMLKADPQERPFESRYIVVRGAVHFEARRQCESESIYAYDLDQGDSLRIPDAWWCRFRTTSTDPLEMLVVCIPRWNSHRYRFEAQAATVAAR